MDVIADIKHYFGFLFERGFRIRSIRHDAGSWIVGLESQDILIDITNDRGEILLSAGNRDCKEKDEKDEMCFFDIGTLVFYISEGKIFVESFSGDLREKDKQFQRLAKILADYIDEIIVIVGKDFEKHKVNLLQTRKVLRALCLQRHALYLERGDSSKKSP
jgi:hypothetical protein